MNYHLIRSRRLAVKALLLPGLAAVLLTGCGTLQQSSSDDALALVIGAHANAPDPEVTGQLAPRVNDAVAAQAWTAIVVNSGRPSVLTQGPLTLDCNNQISCKHEAATNRRLVTGAVSASRAQAPENDLLTALDLGGRTLSNHDGRRTLGVVDSGLQTVAPLRFQDPGMLGADPTEVADYLQRSGALPRLGGVIVIFVGIGDTAAPQEPLPPGARQRLRDIWEAVVRRAGAADVQFVDTPLTNPPAPDLPPVTVVHIADPPSFAAATVDLTDATVGFRPNTAELRDPVGARQVLAELAARIVRDRVPVTLTGATANVGELDGQIVLGRARAEAIRRILVDKLAVPTNLVARVEGVGSAWPGHIPDHDADGKLLPGPAAQNRRVIASFGTPP